MSPSPSRCTELAHGRTGDKGNRSNISVIAYRAEHYAAAGGAGDRGARRRALRASPAHARCSATCCRSSRAMNFVLDDVLDGGVNDALNLDTHGKALSFLLLALKIRCP